MEVLKELELAYKDIPFENSDFQNKAFVMASHQTPARAYRAIGLRMFSKVRAIKELKYSREIEDIDIEEWQQETGNSFEDRRNKLKVAKKLEQRSWTDKLLNDAIKELDCLYAEFKKFPTYSRLEFEAQEVEYFTCKFDRAIKNRGNGTLESLESMVSLEAFQNNLLELDNAVHKSIE